MNKYSIVYSFTFAVINWLEASITLLSLGQYSPMWCMKFAAWFALRKHTKGITNKKV